AAADPWQRTFQAANGAHVLVNVATEADARSASTIPGIEQRGIPAPQVLGSVVVDGKPVTATLIGLDLRQRVNVPVTTDGAGLRGGGVVLERSFADATGLPVGSHVALAAGGNSVELPVVGLAVSPAQARYPRSNPGVAWVSPEVIERLQPARTQWRWVV